MFDKKQESRSKNIWFVCLDTESEEKTISGEDIS